MMLREGGALPRSPRADPAAILEAIERADHKIEEVRRAIPMVEDVVRSLTTVGEEHSQIGTQIRDLRTGVDGLNQRLETIETMLRGVDGTQREVAERIDGRFDTLKNDLTAYFAVVGGIAVLIVLITLLHVL